MHIALLTPSFPPMVDGGVAIATGRLAAELCRRGHRLTVITSSSQNGQAVAAAADAFLAVYDGAPDDPQHQPAAVRALYRWAAGQHRQSPFDVLLAYFVYPSGWLATRLGARLGVPVVCSCRGNDISKDVFTAPYTVASVLRRSTRLLFVSPSLLQLADALVPCRAKATVVPNAVDLERFVPATAAPSACLTVGTSGILRWKKGLDLLLPLLCDLSTDARLRFLIAGYPLDAEAEQRLAAFVSHHGLAERVELTGPVPHEKMVQFLQRMDLYVSTSFQEGMPNGVLEAMACALPVVATDADGLPLLVVDGVTGYLCPAGDLQALLRRCRFLLARPQLRRRMGAAGRRRVEQHFHPEQEAAAIEAVLYQAVKAGPP
ncbi:MAG: hypothetical protein KatS3mg131_3251 [Candidatus Tectimicrobiota bacterium]|nr:MAG: hypothetical protein KatS3mg131_3251 [Candidatus Tectomicrobia bacterium]